MPQTLSPPLLVPAFSAPADSAGKRHPLPLTPQRWWDIGDNPYWHLTLGAGIALLFALTGLPAVWRGLHAVPTAINRVVVQVEPDRLVVYLTLRDEYDQGVAANGYATCDVIVETDVLASAGGPIASVAHHGEYPVRAAQFASVVPAVPGHEDVRIFGCRLAEIPYTANPMLQAAAARNFSAQVSVSFRLNTGQAFRRKSKGFILGVPEQGLSPWDELGMPR